MRLPLGLQRLNLGGRLDPVGRLGQRLGALAQRLLLARFAARSSFCAAKCADVRANTSSCAVLKRRHIASPCVRGASATGFQRACSSRIRRAGDLEVLSRP